LTKKYIAKQANKTNVNKRPNILCFIKETARTFIISVLFGSI
jgi:hypothetical protein